jgi:hypothetical protein
LGGREVEEDNGGDNLTIVENTSYQSRIFYINRRMEHNVVRNV